MKPITPPLNPDVRGEEVANLQEILVFFLENEIIKAGEGSGDLSPAEVARIRKQLRKETAENTYGNATTLLVRTFQIQNGLGNDLRGAVEERTAKVMNEILRKLNVFDLPTDQPKNNKDYTVSGRILNSRGVALAGYAVEAFVIVLRQARSVGKAVSGRTGEYTITFKLPQTTEPDIEVRAYRPDGEGSIARSGIKYNASPVEKLDVIFKAAKIRDDSEFSRLVNDIRVQLNDVKLSDVKEDEKNNDITYLSNKTGWDSRITAMAAGAHQLGEAMKIDPDHIYALLRSGVPATENDIKSLSTDKVKAVIEQAVEKNIISGTGNIDRTINVLEMLAVDYLLRTRSHAAVSTMSDMLKIRLNADQQQIFAQTRKQVGEDNQKLWSALAEKGFEPKTISALQLDGKLGFLTGQNAPLVQKVYRKYNLQRDVELVSSGLYRSSDWKALFGNDIPEGLTADEYADHLSRQVKLSYPTAVVAEMIKNDELLGEQEVPKDELTAFLYTNEAKNSIGLQPVKSWEGFEQLSEEAKASAKMVERMYQITPSDESLTVLSNSGFTSAYQIARYSKQEFIALTGDRFPNVQEAEKTYQKAQEVYSAALGIATTYLTTQTLPNVYAISGKAEKEQTEIVANPTLEELLGNMDYCDCEHCKSVLSPAAYLVELLQFIDLEDVPHAKSNPVDVLTERRPDIQHIQLSCENTNVALPYIDLVNEILEYYIVNGNLTDLKGHDVPEGTGSADLLAEPRFVNETAYDELKTKVYPYNLPFHQPLETLRRLFQMWDVTLENMLAVFATSLSSRKEALNCNEDEYKTLTDTAFKKLPEYFGEPENNTLAQLNAAIADGKTFCRRAGISYEDLAALLKTHFINPGYKLVPLFQKLHISLDDLHQFYAGGISDAEMDAMLPPEIDPADYNNDIKQWLRDNEQLIMGLITLTDIGPEAVECDFSQVELRFALPDDTSNRLTAVAYHKFHRFLRLMHKTGWSIATLDQIIKALLPVPSDEITDANLDAVFVQLFDRMANFKKIAGLLAYSEKKYPSLLLVLDPANDAELRKAECAKILKLSLPELSELGAFTGIDPLADDMETDEPSFMKLIVAAQQLKAASLKVADLAYILHHNDITGKLTPSDEPLLKSVKMLKDTLNAVEKENSAAPENADFNFAKSKMLLVYDAATADNFFELLLNTKTFSAPLITGEEGLPDKLTAVGPTLGFDPFKKEITFAGIMSGSTKTDLENAADSLILADMDTITTQPDLDTFIASFKTAVGQLFADGGAELTTFANNFPELKIIYDAVIAETTPEAQTQKLVQLILPELKARLKINGLQQALISILKTDPDTVSVLTSKKEVIRSETDGTRPVLFDFTELEKKLVFDQNQTYHFYVDVPASDDYLIYLSAPQNTGVSLKINAADVIPPATTIGAEEEVKNAVPLPLTTGKLYPAALTVEALPAGEQVTLSWRTKGIEKSAVPAPALYGSDQVNTAKTSLIRLLKAAQLEGLFKFTAQELMYFASENTETKDFLNGLDTDGSIAAPDLANLWKIIELLLNFNLLKKENEPEENTWLQVMLDPDTKNVQNKFLLEYFNLWQEADLTAVLGHFGLARADLSKLSVLKQVARTMAAVSSIKYPVADLLTWITNDPAYSLVAGIKAAVKQKVTEAVWLETMQTVSDPVRNLLRDALVDYILQYSKPSAEVNTPDKLYEYFLIDVEMDACMKTSRIRQALSTVQLFIERCLMNLEPNVDPASIRPGHWAWMKRYRVWEANRKVFLYPENWLEPELRDNKSYLFKELEGELLQSDITDESAELAFLNYLKKLDDIAKLEIVGTFLEENEQGNQFDDILHVIGRTTGNTRQYFYRRFEYGYWTPWEKVSLNVEGDHIFPVVWRKRLFLFWLTTFEKPMRGNSNKSPQGMSNESWGQHAKKTAEVTICWGEYFKGKWTSPKSTDMSRPMIIKDLSEFDNKLLLVYGRKELVENPTGKFRERLIIYLRYRGSATNANAVFTFTSKNAPPFLEYKDDSLLYSKVRDNLEIAFFNPYYGTGENTQLFNSLFLMPGNTFKVNVKQPAGSSKTEITQTVLTKKNKLTKGFTILPAWYPVENQLEAPLSYSDEHSTFFVQPDESLYTPIRIFDGYYPVYEAPIKYIEIPELVEKPIPGWPPEERIQLEEEILTNPWEWNKQAVRTNDNFSKVLPVTDIFAIGETVFDTGGKVTDISQNSF